MNPFNEKPETPPPSQFDLKPHIEAVESLWKGKEEEKGYVKTLKEMWKGEEEKRGYEIPFVKRNKREKSWIQKVKSMDFGPGGAVGVGCGVGIGVGLIGGVGISENPWNHLKLVIGFGAGCGVGIGYGFGHGLGYFWDRRPPKKPERKIIQI
ncbi:hypothetical protein SUGI_0111250 [Cryptomeria japonica]|uniref:uncharacterized protein LOC131078817 n=1 Tax=Cryptomeria japonica TaxID=3369 RepID=UPI002408C1C1|nr:uncharacterized protein LOC131078817 [Cryptomeria japonica]GLJ09530.1 hypothetical protein SUGI_0111250 [Cryptomeria japonica]